MSPPPRRRGFTSIWGGRWPRCSTIQWQSSTRCQPRSSSHLRVSTTPFRWATYGRARQFSISAQERDSMPFLRLKWLVAKAEQRCVGGLAERLPVADSSLDLVISNGVINLCPDKEAVFREIHRVLKPGGRLQIADVVVQKPLPEDAIADIDLWTG